MIKGHYQFVFRCFLFFVLSIYGCTTNTQNKSNQVSTFSPYEVQLEFESLSAEDRWDYILKIVSANYKNQKQVDEWLVKVCPIVFSEKDKINSTVLSQINRELYNGTDSEPAFLFSENTIRNFVSKEEISNQGYAAATLSNHYQSLKLNDSVKKYNELLKSTLSKDNEDLQIIYFTNEGNYLKEEGYLFESAVNYHKALDLNDAKDSMIQFTLLNNLSGIYYDLNYPDKAKSLIDSAKAFVPSQKWTVESLNLAGLVFSKTKDFTYAKQYFLDAIEKSEFEDNPISLAQSYSNYANFNRKIKRYEDALKFMEKSDSICRILQLDFGLFINQINRAELFMESKDYKKALNEIELVRNDLSKFSSPKLEIDFYELAYRINDAVGNSSQANAYFREHIEKKEALFGDLPRSILAEWELATENEKSTKVRAYLEVQREQESKEKYTIAFLAGLSIFGLSFFFLSRNRKQKIDKQRIAFELELKSKQLITESLKNITIENTKEELLLQLNEILSELPKIHQGKFENLKSYLRIKKSASMLKEFETRFNGVYEYFYIQLKSLAPDLTPNELRVCAFMRLNITTKEIALLTNRSIGTIDNTRSSIRKKLKIEEETNLQEFLLNI